MEEVKTKRTVADIIVDRFLKDVDEKGTMPWQRPYERYNAFNYFTCKTYRGINRLLLPFGEYMTKNQINEYNKKHNEDYRFQKGIEWFPVVFFTVQEKQISVKEFLEAFDLDVMPKGEGYFGSDGRYTYYITKGVPYKTRNVLKYSEVAERRHFKNSKGEFLPSRIESGDVLLVLEKPEDVINKYISREGIEVLETLDTPCYKPLVDIVELNKHTKSEESWYSTAFHEFAHSSGHEKRLAREGVTMYSKQPLKPKEKENLYAVEECIAEITACLLCAECGIYEMETSLSKEYANNIAYVQSWKKRVKDWGREFIYIVSQADKAFNFILGDTEDINR